MALVPLPQATTSVTDPTAPLAAAITHFESSLTDEEKRTYRNGSAIPVTADVIAFVTKVDKDNQANTRQCVASRLSTFLERVQPFVSILDTLVNVHGPIAASVWGGIKLTIVVASNWASYFDKVTNMIMTIGKFCPMYEKFGQLFDGSVDLQHALCIYYAAVIRLCGKVVEVSRRSVRRQVLTSFSNSFDAEFKPYRTDLDEVTKYVERHIDLASKHVAHENARLAALERQESRKSRALSSIFRTDARKEQEDARHWRERQLTRHKSKLKSQVRDNLSTVDYRKAWKYAYQQRSPETAEWLQDDPDFLNWMKNEDTAVLWCPGILGVGKTVLASNIVAYLQRVRNPRDVVCYYFCDAENRASLSPRMILGSFAWQMMNANIENVEYADLDKLKQQTKELDAQEVVDFLLPRLSQNQNYYLVLDGLDEAAADDIKIVAKGMTRLCGRHIKGLKVMYTGRPELAEYLFRLRDFDYRIAMTKSRLLNDIERYSEDILRHCRDEGALKLGDCSLLSQIQDTIRSASEGLFLWTRLYIEEVCARMSDNEILEALRNPPRKISQLIAMKLARLSEHNAANQALKLLQYCGVVRQPLDVNAYQELLSITVGQELFDPGNLPNDMSTIIAACCGLITVDPEENTVHYVHHSVRQHLFLSKDVCGVRFDEYESDIQLGELCLTYLDFNDFKRQLTKQTRKVDVPVRPADLGLLSTARPGSATSHVASKLLKLGSKSRKLNLREVQRGIEKLAGDSESSRLLSELDRRGFHFLDYARLYWIDHSKQLNSNHSTRSWRLFCKVVNDEHSPAIKPWLSGDMLAGSASSPDDIVGWSVKNEYYALLLCVLRTHAKALDEKSKQSILCCITATSTHSVELVSTVLQHAECQSVTLATGLVHAAGIGQTDCVEIYSTANTDLEHQGGSRRLTALQAAAAGGHLDVVNSLLEAGADVNTVPSKEFGRTALQAAAEGGHLDVAERLLTAGADVNACSTGGIGRTALQLAAEGGHLDIVERLLTAGAEVDTPPDRFFGRTALQAAAEGGYPDIVERLLTAGADVNARSTGGIGRTALQVAAEGGHLDVVERLLTAGAEVDAPPNSFSGRTALQVAAEGGYLDIVERLLTAGADVNAGSTGGIGRTALQAAAKGGHLDIVERLLTAGAEVDTPPRGFSGRTALQAAAEGGYLPVVNKLLAVGADANAAPAEYNGYTALQLAVRGGHFDVVNKLLKAGADVNATPDIELGRTALQTAAEEGYLDIVDKLLVAGADINADALYVGRTALKRATDQGHLDVVKRLHEAGAR